MANQNQLAGQAIIRADGQAYKTLPGAKLNTGGTERETKNGSGWTGFTEKRKESSLECEFALVRGMSLQQLNDLDDVTITFEADTGQTFIIPNGWSAGPAEVTDGEGSATMTFNGPPAREML